MFQRYGSQQNGWLPFGFPLTPCTNATTHKKTQPYGQTRSGTCTKTGAEAFAFASPSRRRSCPDNGPEPELVVGISNCSTSEKASYTNGKTKEREKQRNNTRIEIFARWRPWKPIRVNMAVKWQLKNNTPTYALFLVKTKGPLCSAHMTNDAWRRRRR